MIRNFINYVKSLFTKTKDGLTDSGIFYLYAYNKEEINNIWRHDKNMTMREAISEWRKRQAQENKKKRFRSR